MNNRHEGLKLALIQWYDFKYVNDQSKHFRLDCPYMKMTDLYNLIPIESINHICQFTEWRTVPPDHPDGS